MGVSSRFLDCQYINWLRCASSLVILKESLHDYTEAGVRRLYDNVKHNVTTHLGSHFQCSDCSWRGIRQQHNTRAWVIQCNNNICNVWLGEILSKHDDPQCKTINWCNADITKWSTDPWEIAKVYMTNGQRNKTNLPQELDSPALLSLLKYCKEFHPISVQLVSDIIEIRNKVLHFPDLRVSDQDKDTWIDRMLSLVSSMNIEGDTYTNIDKVKTEDIYISFQDQEIKVLQSMVSEVLNEVKGDIDCLMNAQSQHLEEIEKVKESARDNEAEMIGLQTQTQQLETDLKGQKSQLDSYTQVISTLKTFIDNNPDLSSIKISEKLRVTSNEIKALQTQLQTVDENIKGELTHIRVEQEAIKTRMRVEHQEMKGEITAVKDEQEKMKTEMRVEHQAMKAEMRVEHQEMKTEMRVEHQEMEGEITAVKDEQEKMKTEMRVEHQEMKTEMRVEHQEMEGEITAVKDEQEKMKAEIRVEHQAIKAEMRVEHQEMKGEITAVKDEQEKMKAEIRVEHQAIKAEMRVEHQEMKTEMKVEHQEMEGEITAVKDEQEKMKTEMRVEHQTMKTEMRVEHCKMKGEITAVKDELTQRMENLEQDQRKKQTDSSNVRNPVKGSDPGVQELFESFNSILKFIASKSGGVKAIDVTRNCRLGDLSKDANPLLYFLEKKQSLVWEQVGGSQKKIWKLGVKRPSDQELREYAVEKLAQGRRQ